jgi:Lrp/AsnC family leucine-responsive transcriptional regulator
MKLDAHDSKILEILQRDARTSLKEIAEQTGLTSPTVSARLKALEDLGALQGYHADISPGALGQGTMFLVVRSKPSDTDVVADSLASLPLVREVHITGGGRIMVTAVFRTLSDQESVLNDVGEISQVQEYDHYLLVETRKREPLAMVSEGAQVSIQCFYCRKPIEGTPHKIRLDGRDHFLCCPICEREYRAKYEVVRGRAAEEGRKE